MNLFLTLRDKLDHFIIRSLKLFLGLTFSSAALLFGLNLVLRTFFTMQITWIDPLVQYLFVVSGLTGAAYAVKNNENIKIELFRTLAKRKPVQIIKTLIALLVSWILLYVFTVHMHTEFKRQINSSFHIRTWILDLPYIYLFSVSIFYYLLSLLVLFKKPDPEQ